MKPQLLVSAAPHIKTDDDINKIMRAVALGLLPAFLFAFYRFGYWAIGVTAISVITAVLTEAFCQKLRKVPVTVDDYSAVVTGLLLAAVIPPNVSWYIPAIGSAVAIGIAKHCFGGLGANIWNPALIGRAFLQASFPTEINSGIWPAAKGESLMAGLRTNIHGSFKELTARATEAGADVITSATPLQQLADTSAAAPGAIPVQSGALQISWAQLWEAFSGQTFGCIAEISALALLLGGIYLLARGVIRWQIPVAYIATVALLGWLLPARLADGTFTTWFSGPGLYHVATGGVMIGAFFMATDMVTNPMTRKGQLIFGAGCGLITILIRIYSTAYPEGVCYSILLMNTVTPIIDAYTKPRVFGTKKKA